MFHFILKSKQTIFAFISNIFYTFAVWIIAVIINFYYGVEALGEYSLIQAIIAPLTLFFHLQLKVLATIDTNIKKKFSTYLNTYLLSEITFLAIVIILGILLKQTILFYSFAVFKILESLNWLIQGYHQSKNDFYNSFLIALIRSASLLLILWLTLSNEISLHHSFFLISSTWLFIFIFFDIPKIRNDGCDIRFDFNLKAVNPIVISGISLSTIAFLDSLIVAIPRYFIKGYFDETELGKFTMVLQFFIASTIFVISVGHPFLVRLKECLNNNDLKKFRIEVNKTIFIFFLASTFVLLFFILFGKFVLKIVWGSDHAVLHSDLSLSMLGIIPLFLSSVFVYAINALRFFKAHIQYYPIILISQVLMSLILIPKFGITGGIISIITAQFVRMILSGIFYFRLLRLYKKNIS